MFPSLRIYFMPLKKPQSLKLGDSAAVPHLVWMLSMKRPLHTHEQTFWLLGRPPGQAHAWVSRLQVKPCQPRNPQTHPHTPGDRRGVRVQHRHRSSAFDESCWWVLEERRGAMPGIPRITSCREKMQFNIHKSTFGRVALPPVSLPTFPATAAVPMGWGCSTGISRVPPCSAAGILGDFGEPLVCLHTFFFPFPCLSSQGF